MAWWLPGASLNSNSSDSLRVASANPKPAAASPHNLPLRKNCFSLPRESTVLAPSRKPAARSKLSPPSSAVRRHEPKLAIPSPPRREESLFDFPYTINIEWIRRDDTHDRHEHLQPLSHHSCRAGANLRCLLGRRAIRLPPTHQGRSLASRWCELPHRHRAARCKASTLVGWREPNRA